MNKQSSCRVVDVLTIDTWSMSGEISALKCGIEMLYHQKYTTIYMAH